MSSPIFLPMRRWISPALPLLFAAAVSAIPAAANPVVDVPYVVGANDRFDVFVWKHTELSLTLDVTGDGMVRYPLIGDLPVVGRTPDEIAGVITKGLRDYIVDPKVTVIPRAFDKPTVAVIGEVSVKGRLEFQEGAHLSDYLAAAGGPTDDAKLSALTITRQTTGGALNIEVDAEELFKEGDPSTDFILREGDVVYVPTKFSLIDTRVVVLTTTGVIGILATLLRGI
ncbi:MAG: hypothetical protein CME06_00715 [Gemmatimonadetes bacterium]|nr:hypothetical protein [Gemmatimonadota bacterium]